MRYALYQVPGTALAGLALLGLERLGVISGTLGWTLLGLWLGKEVVLYPLTRRAYDDSASSPIGADPLIGARGVAEEDLDPTGYVRVRGELWRAEAHDAVPRGGQVLVQAVRDLTLIVRADDGGNA